MEDDQVAHLLSLRHIGSAGQDHELVAAVLTILGPRGHRQTEHDEGRNATTIDRRIPSPPTVHFNLYPESTRPKIAAQVRSRVS